MSTSTPPVEDLIAKRDAARRDYADLVGRGLSLDLTRGKPSAAQLDLSAEMLNLPGDNFRSADGTDCRNYGGLDGLTELREIFAESLQVPVGQLLAADNSSLALMHDCIVHAMLSPLPGAERPWAGQDRIAFLCVTPGYDRHFALCERFGIEMISVPMTPTGPDMDRVEELVAADAQIKGIWCVPKYSNPDGTCYSDDTVRRLATMQTAAADFRIFWDNAYAVHHLSDSPVEIADLLGACDAAGNADRTFVFGSTSKITLAGGGVAFFGSSPANVAWYRKYLAKRTIGPDKINHLRHVMFLKDQTGLTAHMQRHRELIAPKFEAVDRALTLHLSGSGLATWTSPAGGYFINLQVPAGCASKVVSLAAEAGIALTPAGATHPYGKDPEDSIIRIAPTFPSLTDVEVAIDAVTTCIRLVGYQWLLDQAGAV